MQRWLSGLRRTIGNRVMQECIRRFKSSSLRHITKGISAFCQSSFFMQFCVIRFLYVLFDPHFDPLFAFPPIRFKGEKPKNTISIWVFALVGVGRSFFLGAGYTFLFEKYQKSIELFFRYGLLLRSINKAN